MTDGTVTHDLDPKHHASKSSTLPAILGEAIAPLVMNLMPKPGIKSSEVQIAGLFVIVCLYVFATDGNMTIRVLALVNSASVAMYTIARRSQVKEHHCEAACEHAAELASIEKNQPTQENSQ